MVVFSCTHSPIVNTSREIRLWAPPKLIDVPHLSGWASQWDRLVDSSPVPSPFLRSWWLEGTGGSHRHFLLVVDDAQLLGGLALEQRHRLSSLRVMGDGALCPDHLDLLAAPGHEVTVVNLLRNWLHRPGGRLFDLRGVRAGAWLVDALPGRVRLEPMAAAPFTSLPDNAEAFRATLPKQFRRNLRKSANRFAAQGVAHRTIRGMAVLPRLDILRELHQAQWGSLSKFLPAFEIFLAGCAGGAAVDEVVVHELGRGNLVVAIVLAFEVSGRVSLYQSARLTDPRWRDATTALLADIIDDACARGFTEVDFLRGEESYKGRFTPHHREMFRLVAGSGIVGQFGCVTSTAKFRARQAGVRCVRSARAVSARWKARSVSSD